MNHLRFLAAASACLLAGAAPAADPVHGKAVFLRCSGCHVIDASAGPRMGPPLGGVVGRKAGSVRGYAYSPAMAKAGFVWTPAQLGAFLAAPRRLVPGTKMPFAGLSSPVDRADVAAYLKMAK